MKRVIGGEFEIDKLRKGTAKIPDIFDRGYFYSSGRAALYHILTCIVNCGNKKILLPDYLCESIVNVVKLSAIPYEFYSLNADLSIDLKTINNIYDENTSILIINYFGGVDVKREIERVREVFKNVLIILDNVQALFSMFELIDADFMFTSFRKQLPVPDGAWVVSKSHNLEEVFNKNTFAQYKLAGGLLKYNNQFSSIDENMYLDLFVKGETLIDRNINSCMSDITTSLLQNVDFEMIRNKRIENSMFLIEGLRKIGVSPIIDFYSGKVPLFIPVKFRDRSYIRSLLIENRIFCPIHWPKFSEVNLNKNSIYDEELSLVIDQRYNIDDIKLMLSIIELGLKNGA